MALPFASALSRRDRLWPAVSASVVAHLLLVGWAVARRPPPPIDLEQKPIVAKLVRLGEKRPEQFLPRKEPPPPAPAAAPAPVVSVPAAAPAKPAAPATAAKKPAPVPAPVPAAPPSPGKAGGSTLASVLSKVQREVEQDRYGAPDGDPSGDSATGEGDRYFALVDRAVRANYVVPSTISDRERLHLEANVVLWIAPDGRIVRWKQERPSGNPAFDAAIDRTLQVTTRVPPPPDDLRDVLRNSGMVLVFRARNS